MTNTELPNDRRVHAWMNTPEHTITADAFADDAFKLMKRAGVRHLLVTKEDDLVGVVTDRDLRRPDWADGDVMSVRDMYLLGKALRVSDVMTSRPVTISPSDYTANAACIMVDNKFDCLPVVSRGRLVGIITSSDLLAALVHQADPEFLPLSEAG